MAVGTIAMVGTLGNGTITPDSRGEAVTFGSDLNDGYLVVGDRVWFLAELTVLGVVATKLHRIDPW